MTRAEQETTISWDEVEKTAHWYSCSTVEIRKMDKLALAYPDVYKLAKRTVDGAWYVFPIKYLRVRKPPSEKQREAGRAKAAKWHEKRSKLASLQSV